MSVFKSFNITTNKAIEKGEDFIKSSEKFYKLKLFQMVTASISMLLKFAIFGLFIIIAFLFIAVGISTAIGNYLNNETAGHLIVALLFTVFAFISYKLRHYIENIVIRKLSLSFFEDDEDI